jgi:hypothetical protein
MKKLAAICLLIASLHARADLVLVEKIDGMGPAGQSGEITIKIKGDKIRTDISSQMSSIMDTNSGDMITIMHEQKSYLKMSADKTKAMMEQMRAMQGKAAPSAPPEPPKFVSTGQKDEVNGFKTEVYTATYDGKKITAWVALDYPNASSVMKQFLKMQEVMQSKFPNAAPKMDSLPGLPVKTEMEVNGQKMTTTLVSVKEQPVDAADLEIPAGYTEMQMPTFNMPAAKP